MRVNKWLLPALALALLLSTVGAAQAMGLWQVSGREMVNLEHLASGADVKGWMTLQQVADGSGLTLAALYTRLGLPDTLDPQTALKELEGVVEGFETSVVRTVVDEALGLAPASGEDGGEPAEAAPDAAPVEVAPAPTATAPAIAAPAAEITPAAAAPTETPAHLPAGDGGASAGSGAGSDAGSDAGESRPAVTSVVSIKGSHTLREIADATGIDLADLLAALELPPDTGENTAVRELVAAGLLAEVEDVRTAVAELQ